MVKKMDDYLYSSYLKYKNNDIHQYCIDLLFNTKDYHNFFDFIHKNFEGKNVMDIDENRATSEEIVEFLEDFYKKQEIKKEDIIKNNFLVVKVHKELKEKFDLTNKEIAEFLGIGKNRLANIMKKI